MTAIRKWVVPISGFTQTIGQPNGFDKLWRQLRALSRLNACIIEPQRWRARFDHLASFIVRHSNGHTPEIHVPCYSWGCGHGFISFAKELRKRGVEITTAILCDPVYHHWLRPWRALIFSPQIVIPDNVRTVFSFRQFVDWPRGTELKAADPEKTTIVPPLELIAGHVHMDDQPQFHAKVLEVVQQGDRCV